MANYRIPGPLDASRGNHDVRDGTLQRKPGVTPGFISGSTPGNTSPWDTLVKGVQRIDAVTDAIQVGRERAGAAILKETGHALEEVVKGLIPGLLLMLLTVVATTVIGGAIGAAVGALAFGVGAAPGAVVGADLGFSAGMSILTWLGLGFLAVSIAKGFGEMIGAISVGTTRAWEAPDSPRPRAEIEKAGDEYAHAIALLFKFILMAIVIRLAGPASEALIGQLRKSRLGEGFASWVVRNKEALLKNPKLQAPRPKAVQSEKPVAPAVTPSQAKSANSQQKTPPPPPPPPPLAPTSPLGKVISTHTAVDPGPLDPSVAGTFSGGRYSVVKLENDTTLYRAGTAGKPLGQFFDTAPPDGILQARIDKAVLPTWPGGATSPIDTSFALNIPKGTTVYVGEVGSQGGFYVGGTQQIVVLKPWTIEGVEVLSSTPLK